MTEKPKLESVEPTADPNMNVLLYGPPKVGKAVGSALVDRLSFLRTPAHELPGNGLSSVMPVLLIVGCHPTTPTLIAGDVRSPSCLGTTFGLSVVDAPISTRRGGIGTP